MDGHRASGYVQPPPGHLVPFLSPLFSKHHIWTAPTACNSNNSWNPHERFKSKKSVEILPLTLVSFDGNSFKRSNWEQKFEQQRTKLIEQKFLKQILRSYYKQKCSTTREFFFFSITTKQWSEGKSRRISMKTEVSLHLWYVLKQSLHSFSNQNYAKTRQLKYSWKPSQNPRNADRSRILIGLQ